MGLGEAGGVDGEGGVLAAEDADFYSAAADLGEVGEEVVKGLLGIAGVCVHLVDANERLGGGLLWLEADALAYTVGPEPGEDALFIC